MDTKNPSKNKHHQNLMRRWKPNSFPSKDLEPQEQHQCSPYDCMCGFYDNTYDNYFYSHQQNPAQQHFAWIFEWKKFHWQLQQDLKALGQNEHTNEYVKGYLDAVSYEYPLNISTMSEEMEFDVCDDYSKL